MCNFKQKAEFYLNELCVNFKERCLGDAGNIEATTLFENEMKRLNWKTESYPLDVINWESDGAKLFSNNLEFSVLTSPYSLGCSVKSQLIAASTIDQLENIDAKSKIVLLYGDIAKEQIMPKNFVFYNPDNHKKIISLLEKSNAKAVICATGRNSSLAGGSYPFPLIEDGDFDVPSVYMTEEEGNRLLPHIGSLVTLESISKRIPSKAYNIIAIKGKDLSKKIVITAHIDAKKGTPGALDNASGVIVLLLLADLLKDYDGKTLIEIAAFNGEDYYAVPGQMNYIAKNNNNFDDIILNINIDGAGYKDGKSAFSFYGVEENKKREIGDIIKNYPGIKEGVQWVQGDHSIFIQYGRPAIAVSSEWLTENFDSQEITHTEKDTPQLIDCAKLVEISLALAEIIRRF